MKALFFVFHTLKESCGISKKIRYQAEAFRKNGVETKLCYYKKTQDKHYCRMVNERTLLDYGTGIIALIKKRFFTKAIPSYVRSEGINLVYIRWNHNANPWTIRLVKQLKMQADKLVLEIPTYPYDGEYKTPALKLFNIIDRCFRNTLAKYVDYIVTFSEDEEIFGRPTIRISNGIDFNVLPLKVHKNDTSSELHMIFVATMSFWHGVDRLLYGMAQYYGTAQDYRVYLHLVGGYQTKEEERNTKFIIDKYQLNSYVILHGVQNGEKLDALFEMSDIAIGSLGLHRMNITNCKTLKNREYAARGLAFAYAQSDPDFDHQAYILKLPSDESPINIQSLINFYRNIETPAEEIRNSIAHLSWENQIKKVLEQAEA